MTSRIDPAVGQDHIRDEGERTSRPARVTLPRDPGRSESKVPL